MGKSVNTVVISGNLGRDPEVTYAKGGTNTAVCKFSVAVSDRKKVDGDWKDATIWVRVTCFGKTAETAGQHLHKGSGVVVSGRLEVDEWTDKDGKARTTVGVIANDFTFMGGKDSAGGVHAPAKAAPAQGDGFVDEDLPFARCEPVGVWW